MWKRIRWLVWGLFAFLVIYTGISVYFMDRFFPGTSINNTNAEYLTVDQVNELLMSQAQTYKLTLLGREGETEELDSADLGVTYYETDAAGQIKRIQNGFLWLRMFWQRDSYHLTPGVAIDEEQFRAAVRDLELVKNGKHPQNAWVELTEDGYELHEEQPGNRLGIRNLEEQMKELVETVDRDDVITFEELGIDSIMVDEAHAFKRLTIFSKMTNVAGITGAGSKRAMDMYLKCQYINEINGGRGIVFATGTLI